MPDPWVLPLLALGCSRCHRRSRPFLPSDPSTAFAPIPFEVAAPCRRSGQSAGVLPSAALSGSQPVPRPHTASLARLAPGCRSLQSGWGCQTGGPARPAPGLSTACTARVVSAAWLEGRAAPHAVPWGTSHSSWADGAPAELWPRSL